MATKTAAAKTAAAKADDKAEESKTASTGLGFDLNVKRAAVTEIKRQPPKREKEENPTEEAVKHSLDTGDVLEYTVPNGDPVKKVTGLLRRAAADAGHGIQLQPVDNGDGTTTINFKSVTQKRSRKYTADDIRAWAKENGLGDYAGKKIPDDVRDAFKNANGFGKKSKASAK